MRNNSIKIPFFLPYVDSKDITEIKKAASSIFLTNGPKLDAFEQKFKNFTIKSEIPFAPFLIIGTAIIFWGDIDIFYFLFI